MTARAACFAALLASTAAGMTVRTAAAQGPAQVDADEARELFAEGERAFAEGSLADARRLFRRSLDLHPHPATAFNLAVAMREAGAYRDSAALYDELLAGRYGELDDAQRTEVESLRAQVRGRIARLSVRAEGADGAIELLVDGRRIAEAHAGTTTEAEVDPGEHVVTARAPGYTPVDETVRVDAGEIAEVHLALREPVVVARPAAPAGADDGGGSTWLWLAVVAGVLVAGAIVAAVLLTRDDEPDLPDDLVFGQATTLRW